jgi:hypothetical protein
MIVGTPEAGPETVTMLLNKFADRTYGISADRLAAASTKPGDLIRMAREAIGTGNIVSLNAPTGIAGQKDKEIEELEAKAVRLEQMLQQLSKK